MKKLLWYKLNLQLFADGGNGVSEADAGDDYADAGQRNDVNYDNEFNSLINGKFKEQFTKRTQEIIDKRFKQTKELEAYRDKISPQMDKLLEKYSLSQGQEDELFKILSSERNDGDASELEASSTDEAIINNLRNKTAFWIKESKQLKEAFPDFDLREERRNNEIFPRLLLSGIDMKTAYETVHKDEILSGVMAYTAGKVREQVVEGIRAKGMRPRENGISSSGAVITSVDVNALTSKDILKILKQVENGASVKF